MRCFNRHSRSIHLVPSCVCAIRNGGSHRFSAWIIGLLLGAAGISSARATPSFDWDFKKYYSHAESQPASLTPEQLASIEKLDACYRTPQIVPNGKGLTDVELAEVEAMPAYFALKRDPETGVLTGRGIVADNDGSKAQPDLTKPASLNADFTIKVERLVNLYSQASKEQAPKLIRIYADLIEHFLDQGYLPGKKEQPWLGNGYIWREHGWKTLRMVDTLPAGKRDLYALSLSLLSGFNTLVRDNAATSTDHYHNYFDTAQKALAQMSDTPAKWQYMRLLRRGLDITITGKDEDHPTQMLVPLDGSPIHHTGFQNRYGGYSYAQILALHARWTAAGFTTSYTANTIDRLRRGALAWCFITTPGGLLPLHERMDASFQSGNAKIRIGLDANGPSFATGAARLTSALRGTPIAEDLEMAYAAIASAGEGSRALPPEWRGIKLPANIDRNSPLYTASMVGHYSHTTNGVALQRVRDDWYVSVRGQHTHWRGGESHAGVGFTDHFSVKALDGSMQVIAAGKEGRKPNEVDSGFRYEGWDHFYYPNVTCGDGAPKDLLYHKTFAFFGGTAKTMGNADLRESGLWMAQINRTPARKSAFFLGNRVVLLTTDAKGQNLHTGLIQYAHTTPKSEPLTTDGEPMTEDGERTLSAGGGHKLVDPQGNGYFVHPDATTPPIKIRRGEQSWLYALPNQYKGEGKAPSFNTKKEFLARTNDFTPTTANYSRVWFDHGAEAEGQSIEYTLLVKPKPGELDAYAKAMADPATAPVVITRTPKAHFFRDRATGTYAAAMFDASEPIVRNALLTVNRTGAYIWRRDNDRMHLSVSSADIKDTRPFEVTLAGKWTIEGQEDTYQVKAISPGDNTVVSLSYRQAYPQRITLRSQTAGK